MKHIYCSNPYRQACKAATPGEEPVKVVHYMRNKWRHGWQTKEKLFWGPSEFRPGV